MRSNFPLDRIRIERRAIGPRHPFVVGLPLPGDTMYISAPGRKPIHSTAHVAWLERARSRLAAAPRFKGPVWIAITLADGAEIDNKARPILDFLVREGVIESRGLVRALRLMRGDVGGARVEVRPFAFEEA